MVGNRPTPHDDLYHENPAMNAQTRYIAAPPKMERDSASFFSELSFGMMNGDPKASITPSHVRNKTPQTDRRKQALVPVAEAR